MRKVLGKMKRTLSILLAVAMIVTGLPQTSASVYAAELPNISDENGISSEADNGAGDTGEKPDMQEPGDDGSEETGTPDESGSGETQTPGEDDSEGTQTPDEGGSEEPGKPDEGDTEGTETPGENVPGDQDPDENDPEDPSDENEGETGEEDGDEADPEEEGEEDDLLPEEEEEEPEEESLIRNGISTYAADPTIKYTITDDGTLTEYSTGSTVVNVPSEINGKTVLKIGNGSRVFDAGVTQVTLPGSVTSIGGNAFSGCTALTSVNIPEGVTSISYNVFYNCTALTGVVIPDSVIGIGSGAFESSGLTAVKVPSSVKNIGYAAFKDCSSLVSAEIAGGEIGTYGAPSSYAMFRNCTALKELTFGEGVTGIYAGICYGCSVLETLDIQSAGVIPSSAFKEQTSLTSVTIGDSVTAIGPAAFSGCTNLSKVTIGKNVEGIGSDAFYNCKALTGVVIPDSVTGIGSGAFESSGLTAVKVPSSVQSIGYAAFKDCSSLASAEIANGEIGTYGAPSSYAMFLNCTALKELTFGEGVTGIYADICYGCSILETLDIQSAGVIPSSAFKEQTSLTSVTIGDSVTAIGPAAFSGCTNLSKVTIGKNVEGIGSNAFYNCKALTGVVIPDSVTGIGSGAFEFSGLTAVKVPSSVQSIGYAAFKDCSSLASAEIASGEIGTYGAPSSYAMFRNCTALKELTFGEGVTGIYAGICYGCSALETLNIQCAEPIPSSAFTGSGLTSLAKVTIGDSVTSIGSSAFSGCTKLAEVTLGRNIASIGYYAFNNCTALTGIVIPDSVTRIGDEAFASSGLTSVKVPSTVQGIGYGLFKNCSSLASAEIAGGEIGTYGAPSSYAMFLNCKALTELTFGEGVTGIYEGICYGCSALETLNIQCAEPIPSSAFTGSGLTSLAKVTIGDGVTRIGSSAFSGCTKLAEVTLGRNIASIGYDAFNNCTALTEIVIPDSVTSIGDEAFASSGLTSVKVPSTVQSIGYGMFKNCSSLASAEIAGGEIKTYGAPSSYAMFLKCTALTDLTFGADVVAIPSNVCYGCTQLENVTINCGSIQSSAFSGRTSIKNLTLGDGVTSIGSSAFGGCTGLSSVSIPGGEIGSYAFSGCENLAEVTIGKDVTDIKSHAFENCPITEIDVPAGVKTISEYAFAGSSLTSATIAAETIGNGAFRELDTLTQVTLGDGVKEIGSNAFYNCDGITSITIPDTVQIIGASAFGGNDSLESIDFGKGITEIGDNAFNHCDALKQIKLPDTVQSIGEGAFAECEYLHTADIPSGILGKESFKNCIRLMTLSLGDKVTEIGERAFYGCGSLPKISGMAGVTEIGEEAFSGCGSLTEITLPMGMDVIHEGAFQNTGLQSVTIPASVVSIEKNAFYGSKLKEINFTEGGGLQTIGESAFEGCRQLQNLSLPGSLETVGSKAFEYCDALESVAIGSGVIGENAFYGCSNLTEVLFSDKVTEIGRYGFGSCTKLESLLIPDSVGTIGSNAFDSCRGMKEITLPDGIETIAPYTFSGCASLQSIAIPDSVKEIGDSAFYGCNSLKDIQMADGLQSIGTQAFCGCSALLSVSIPDSVTVLGNSAFAWCSNMTGIYLSNNLTDMGENTFEGCTALERVNIPESLSHIGQYSFSGCKSLKKILIPSSIKTIGIGAFQNCDNLTDIFFTGTREEWEALIASGNDNLKGATIYPGSRPTMAYFDPQGGSEVPAQAVTVNDVLIKPNDPVREHYIFGGWFREATCENVWNFETDRVQQEITLYAKWIPSYTVTFESNGGSVVESVTLPAGAVLEAPEDPVYATYTFEGWFKDEECTQPWKFGDAVTADMTLYAKWAEVRFTVVFRTGEGSEVESQEIHEGEPVPRPEDPSREGYTFRGWYMAELSEPLEGYLWDFDTAITGYTEIYAFWEINKYTVSFDCGGGSEAEPVVVEFGQTVPQPDVTREGYALEGWYTDAAYVQPWDFMNDVVKSDITLYVKWDKIYADIDADLSVSGGDEQAERFKLAGVLVSGNRIVVQNETVQRMKAGTENQQKILNDLRGADGVIHVDYIVKPKGSGADRIVRYAVADTELAAKEKTFEEAVPYTDGGIFSVPVVNNNDEILIGVKTQYYHWFDEDGESVGITRNDKGIDISVEADNEFSVFGQTGYVLLPPEGVDYMRYGVRITAADTLEIKSEQLLTALAGADGNADRAFLSGLAADSSKDGTTAYINVGVPVPEGSDELYSCGMDTYHFNDGCSLITYYSDSKKYFVRSIPVAVKGTGSAESGWTFGNIKDKEAICQAMRLRWNTQESETYIYQNLGALYLYNNPVPMRTTDSFVETGKKKTAISWDLERNTVKPDKKQYFMNDTTSIYLTSQIFVQDTNGQIYDELPEKYKDYTVEWKVETKSGNEIAVFVFDEADTTHQRARLDITPVKKGSETLTVTAVLKHPRLIDTVTCTLKTTVKAKQHAESISSKDKVKQLILGKNGKVSYKPSVTLAPAGVYEKAAAVVWSCESNSVQVNGQNVTFTEEGEYTLQGTLAVSHLVSDKAAGAEESNTSLTVEIPVTVFASADSSSKLNFTASHKFPYKYTWTEKEPVYDDEDNFVKNKTVTHSEYRNYKTIKLDTGERSENFDADAVKFVYAGGESGESRVQLSVDDENSKPALNITVSDEGSAFTEKVTVWYKGRSKVLTVSYDPYTGREIKARLILGDEKAGKLSPDSTYSYEFYDQKIVDKNKKHWKKFEEEDEDTGEVDTWWGYEEGYEPEDETVSVPSENLKITLNNKLLAAQAAGRFTLNQEGSSFSLNGPVSGGKLTFQIVGTKRKASVSFSTASLLPDDFTLNVLTEPYCGEDIPPMDDDGYWDEKFKKGEEPDWGDEEEEPGYANGYYLAGTTVSLEALTEPGAANQDFTWKVDDKKLASIAAVKGDKSHATLTLKKTGTVTVTAQCKVWEESYYEDDEGEDVYVRRKVTKKESVTIEIRSNQRSFMEAGQAVSQAEVDLQDVFTGTRLRLEGDEGDTGFDSFGRSARVVSLVKGKYQDVQGYRCEWEGQYVYLQANRRGKVGNLYIALDGYIEGKPATLYVPIKISFR